MSALLNIKWQNMAFPFVGLLAFLFFWQIAASQVTTTLGSLPGPVATAQQFMGLVDEHEAEQDKKTIEN
jgi:nitrate/nitrite transport system permease protein